MESEQPATAAPQTADPADLNKLRRFIYVGLEENKYFPGCWKSHKYFEADKLPVMAKILEAEPKCQAICDIIKKAYDDGLYSRYEAIVFAMCKCLLLGKPEMRMMIYKLAEEVCKTPEELFTFINFTRKLKTGSGSGWCRTVGNWYRTKPPMELAMEVARVRGYCNQKHENVVRKSHLCFEEGDHARSSIVKYVLFGLKCARQEYAAHTEAEPVLDWLQRVEELRRCEHPPAAADTVRQHSLTLHHVPGHLLTDQGVWEAVLPNMPLRQVLGSVLRIHNMGFLKEGSTTVAVLESLLTNAELVRGSNVSPLEVYIAIKSYVLKKVPTKNTKLKFLGVKKERRRVKQHLDPSTLQWVWNSDKPRHPKEQKYWGIDTPPNPTVESALFKTLSLSWPQPTTSGVRYLITLDMREHMFKGRHYCLTSFKPPKKDAEPNQPVQEEQLEPKQKKKKRGRGGAEGAGGGETSASAPALPDKAGRGNKHKLAECFYHKSVTPGHAAVVTALTLYRQQKETKIAVFTDTGIQLVDLGRDNKNLTVDKVVEKLKKAKLGRVLVDAPMEWAAESKTRVDVFVNLIDRQSRCAELEAAERGGRGAGGGYGAPPPPGSTLKDRCPVRALQRYREQMKLPDARLITMSLASHRVRTADPTNDTGVLDIVGIDEHVPDLIQAFSKKLFD